MSTSPPQYTLLPSSPAALNEKPPLHRAPSATPQSTSLDSPSSPRSRFRRAIFFATGALAITVLVASLYATNLAFGGGGFSSCSRWSGRARETVEDMTRLSLRKRDSAVESPTYSTTTYSNGETSTFVYTTRPIVNPGGYTFGTMTGYVVETATPTSESSSASSSAEPASSTSPSSSWSEVQETVETASPTYSTSTRSSTTETYVYTTRPIVNPGGYTIGTMTGYVPVPTASSREGFSATTIPSSPSPTPTAAPLAERDFAEVDMHLMHRRGLDFEEAAVSVDETSTSGTEQYSLSTNKDGETVTYVKTTRPIVNPGGYTIGTLDGAYVKAPQSTQHQTRDELKRRAIELEA